MATSKKEKQSKPSHDAPVIPPKYQHAAAIAVILLSLIIYFNEVVLNGKVFVAADNIASKSFETLVIDANQQGIPPLWNPYIFCGMPGVASMSVGGERLYDVSAFILATAQVTFRFLLNNSAHGGELFYYLIFGMGVYFFMWDKTKNKTAALISSLAVMHSTRVVILLVVGHVTKVPVLAFFPFIFLILERLREKFNLALSLVLVVLVHLMFLPGHIQMIFYCYFALGIYYLFFLVRTLIKNGQWLGIVRSGAVFAVATGLAFAMTGDQYLSTLEYSNYSMRGSDPIVQSQQQQEKSGTGGGLDYEYATNWSFSPGEVFTFFIPSWYGFSSGVPYRGPETQNQEARLPLYFGSMPHTDAPEYMGIVILVLAGIGFWRNRKDPFVQFSLTIVLIALFISFGRNFSLLYDLMFNFFPMFNKFRAPSMILILAQMMVPVLAGYGIVTLMNDKGVKYVLQNKTMLYSVIALGGLLILSVIGKEIFLGMYEMFIPEQALAAKFGNSAPVAYKIVTGMVSGEITSALLMLVLVLGGFYLYQIGKLSIAPLVAGLVAVVLFDLWNVNFKFMEAHDRKQAEASFEQKPPFVEFLLRDTTLYRTMQFQNGQPPYDNSLAYWRIQNAYGYHGAKMRQIQDAFDVAGVGNPLLWGLMNVKYIISDRPDSNQVLQPVFSGDRNILYNRAELPRAFFVNRYETATGIDILNKIKEMNFNPRETAFFMEDPKLAIDPPRAGASVGYSRYGIQEIELKVKATGNNLIFLSESWYPEGWKAFVDGNEIPIHRINYMFRGIVVSEGEHIVAMKFEPRGFYLGRQLSLWINILILGGIGYFAVVNVLKKKKAV